MKVERFKAALHEVHCCKSTCTAAYLIVENVKAGFNIVSQQVKFFVLQNKLFLLDLTTFKARKAERIIAKHLSITSLKVRVLVSDFVHVILVKAIVKAKLWYHEKNMTLVKAQLATKEV